MRDFVMPKCPEKWTYEERMFYRGIQEALETLGAKVSENDLADKLKKKLFSSQDDASAIINYSTSEVATGGRWVDGKPLYRRLLIQPINKASSYTDYDIGPDVDMIINFSGVLVLSNGTERPLGWWWSGGNDRWTVYRYGKSNLVSFWATAVPSTGYVLIEYTKTTDQPAT